MTPVFITETEIQIKVEDEKRRGWLWLMSTTSLDRGLRRWGVRTEEAAAPSAPLLPRFTFTSLRCIHLKQNVHVSVSSVSEGFWSHSHIFPVDLFWAAARGRFLPSRLSAASRIPTQAFSKWGRSRPSEVRPAGVWWAGRRCWVLSHQLAGGWLGSALPEWSSSALSQSESSYRPWSWIIWVRTATGSLTWIHNIRLLGLSID